MNSVRRSAPPNVQFVMWRVGSSTRPSSAPLTAKSINESVKELQKLFAEDKIRIPAEYRYASFNYTPTPGFYGIGIGHMLDKPPAIPASKPLPVDPRHALEMQRNGVALSALDKVPARKAPEPWIPSCDEDYWLPDAGR